MTTRSARVSLVLALASVVLGASVVFGAPPAPCQILPAEVWSSIMGYPATATPGDMYCTYEGAHKAGGGQFRIIAIVGSKAEAEAGAKRLRDRHPKSGHGSDLAVVDSEGTVVLSIALFQDAATEKTPSQLQKLVAAAKQHLAK